MAILTPDRRRAILEVVAQDGRNVAAHLAERHSVTRQAASAWLAGLKKAGLVTSTGVGRGVRYQLAPLTVVKRDYPRTAGTRHTMRALVEEFVGTGSMPQIVVSPRLIRSAALDRLLVKTIHHAQVALEVMRLGVKRHSVVL